MKMRSGNELTLNDIFHAPNIRKNLVFRSLSEKIVLNKNEMIVRKSYLNDGLFKMNVMIVDLLL